MDKTALIDAHRAALHATLDDLRATADAARAGTRVDGTHRPENRGERAAVTSQGYLAHGLGQRMAELEEALRLLDLVDPGPRDKVAVGAVVTLIDEDDRRRTVAVLPGGDGARRAGLEVVSPASPLVAPFLGLEAGEVADVRRGSQTIEVEVEAIA